jgi:hypothetical protein
MSAEADIDALIAEGEAEEKRLRDALIAAGHDESQIAEMVGEIDACFQKPVRSKERARFDRILQEGIADGRGVTSLPFKISPPLQRRPSRNRDPNASSFRLLPVLRAISLVAAGAVGVYLVSRGLMTPVSTEEHHGEPSEVAPTPTVEPPQSAPPVESTPAALAVEPPSVTRPSKSPRSSKSLRRYPDDEPPRAGAVFNAPPRFDDEAVPTADAAPRLVKVVVVPHDASVEVDGTRARTRSGLLEIKGAIGSVHRVRVFKGKVERSTDVTITDAGPYPPKVELRYEVSKPNAAPAPMLMKAREKF